MIDMGIDGLFEMPACAKTVTLAKKIQCNEVVRLTLIPFGTTGFLQQFLCLETTSVVTQKPMIIDHIQPLRTFHPNVFPWEHNRKTLDKEFHRIQNEAGINLSCNIQQEHDCTPTCHLYGFHAERRAFATMNAMNMTREALQALMRHQSPMTTDRDINFAQQINPAVESLYVPDVLKVGGA
jgi:hypothetical protein